MNSLAVKQNLSNYLSFLRMITTTPRAVVYFFLINQLRYFFKYDYLELGLPKSSLLHSLKPVSGHGMN